MKKTIITVVGKDCVGIIAKVCSYLADRNINILDISQTIVSGYFNMMMIVESDYVNCSFTQVKQDMDVLGAEIGVTINVQHEDIFKMMHRV